MLRRSSETWERRKWYLIRSLFVNTPTLSPIRETQEQASELQSPTEGAFRPYSPLPELVIEKEPNRHDEPEEYYQNLEKRIKRVYKKIFFDTVTSIESTEDGYNYRAHRESSASEGEADRTELSSNGRSHSSEEPLSDQSSIKDKTSTLPSENGDDLIISYKTKLTQFVEETDASSLISTSPAYEIITTQAEVYEVVNKEVSTYLSPTIPQLELAMTSEADDPVIREQSKSTIIIGKLTNTEISDEQQEEIEEEEVEEEIVEKEESESTLRASTSTTQETTRSTSIHTDSSLAIAEPEIMRRRNTSELSAESTNANDIQRHFSTDFSFEKDAEVAFVRQMDEAEEFVTEVDILGASVEYTQQDHQRKRRIVELSHISSPKRLKFDSRATQTSFSTSDEECSWQELKEHFFEGNPCIYTVCSCSNHVCC